MTLREKLFFQHREVDGKYYERINPWNPVSYLILGAILIFLLSVHFVSCTRDYLKDLLDVNLSGGSKLFEWNEYK